MTLNWDVLIPAYNASKHVKAAVDSADSQHPRPAKVVVCDDASEDDTFRVVESMQSASPVRNSQNVGVGETRQTLLALSDAEWILYLDADDTLVPGAADTFAAAVAKHPDAVVHAFSEVSTGATFHIASTGPLDEPARITHRDLLARNPICSSATLIRRDAALAAGGFYSARRLIDYCIWFRIARTSPSGILLYRTPVVRRLISASTITGNVNAAVVEEARLLEREWEFSYGRSAVFSHLRKQLRLLTLWLRGLSRHTDYGKPGSDYVSPSDVQGLWRVFGLLGWLRSRVGLRTYAAFRRLKDLRAILTRRSSDRASQ